MQDKIKDKKNVTNNGNERSSVVNNEGEETADESLESEMMEIDESPEAVSPEAVSPDVASPEAVVNAQTRESDEVLPEKMKNGAEFKLDKEFTNDGTLKQQEPVTDDSKEPQENKKVVNDTTLVENKTSENQAVTSKDLPKEISTDSTSIQQANDLQRNDSGHKEKQATSDQKNNLK